MSFDPIVNGALAFLAVLILMALNIPIGISMLIVGFTGFGFIVGFEQAFFILGTAPYEAVSKYSLSVLPFFVLMGNLANRANLSRNLYDAAYAIVGHYKGGLAMSTVGACAGFGMICGSSIATAATMSQMAAPEMISNRTIRSKTFLRCINTRFNSCCTLYGCYTCLSFNLS